MKKILLSASMALLATIGNAQIICYVEAPSVNEGNYDFTYATGATWAVPDLTVPANAVNALMQFTAVGNIDSLACNPLPAGSLTGKIAVLYRGSCEFGLKSYNAQQAGAIGVIIVNNGAGAPVAMGGGADGLNVTIPVIMVSNVTGALLRPEIIAGTSTVFIGSKNGLYPNDIGFTDADLLRAKSFSNLQLLSQSATEFEVEVGTWVRNYGQNNQIGVTLNCMIDLGASNLYNATSSPFNLNSGDSVFVPLPAFSQATYANGLYEMTYTVAMTPLDQSTYDNVREANFIINDDYWSYANTNPTTLLPVTDMTQFNGTTTSLETCIHFQDANASRVAIEGINFSAGTSQNPTATSIDGEFIEVSVYEWTDVFTQIDLMGGIPDLNNIAINEIATAEYIYTTNAQGVNVYAAFDNQIVLEDDMRYLFCLNIYSPAIYPGYDSKLDYNWNFETYLQPINMLRTDGGQWYPAGYGTDQSPAISIKFFDASGIGMVELPKSDLVAYPNPANQLVNIPMNKMDGNINVEIYDIEGRVVGAQNVVMNTSRLTVDVTTLPTGIYNLKLTYEDGTCDNVKVVVSK